MPVSARGFVLKARAKFNLLLEIGALNPGGRHNVRSVVADLLVCDELAFLPSDAGFDVTCDGFAIPQPENLAWRAAHALGVDLPSIRIHIRKALPVEAGLGGGSADAAAALRGIAMALEHTGITVSRQTLWAAAARVGSDIPACMLAGLKVVEGRGEIVRALPAPVPPWGVLLFKPAIGVATANAYRLLDGARESDIARVSREDAVTAMCDALATGDFERVCALIHNDFQPIIERAYPPIAQARRRVARTGAAATILCGSGACVAGLFESAGEAEKALALIRPDAGEWAAATGFADDA